MYDFSCSSFHLVEGRTLFFASASASFDRRRRAPFFVSSCGREALRSPWITRAAVSKRAVDSFSQKGAPPWTLRHHRSLYFPPPPFFFFAIRGDAPRPLCHRAERFWLVSRGSRCDPCGTRAPGTREMSAFYIRIPRPLSPFPLIPRPLPRALPGAFEIFDNTIPAISSSAPRPRARDAPFFSCQNWRPQGARVVIHLARDDRRSPIFRGPASLGIAISCGYIYF